MAYSDFTNIAQVEKQFGVRQTLGTVFTAITPMLPSEHLLLDLADVQEMPLSRKKYQEYYLAKESLRSI